MSDVHSEGTAMGKDDRLFATRVALFARVGEVCVAEDCRQFQVHRSTYYRWKASVERHGLEMLRPRERRLPRMPNQTQPWLEDRIIGFALGPWATANRGPAGIADAGFA